MFIRYPSRRGDVPLRKLVPNLITAVALCSGLAALHFAIMGDWDRALSAIAASAIFDALDGRFARLLRVSSPFGAVLDSLSDFVSFGVAPALVLHLWMLGSEGTLGLAAVMTFALCSALRLARFTAAVKPTPRPTDPRPTEDEARRAAAQSKFFTGMPTPAAASAVLVPVMIEQSRTFHDQRLHPFAVVAYTFLVAFLMIGRQPMFSFKKLRVDRRWAVPLLVVAALVIVVGATKDPWLTAALLAGAYLLTLPLAFIMHRRLTGPTPAPAL